MDIYPVGSGLLVSGARRTEAAWVAPTLGGLLRLVAHAHGLNAIHRVNFRSP